MVSYLQEVFEGTQLFFAGAPQSDAYTAVEYAIPRTNLAWVLGANDYLAAANAAQQHHADVILLLGTDVTNVAAEHLRKLAEEVRLGIDLAIPCFLAGPEDALVSKALLYPLTRTLFTADIRYPLPVDAALSPRMLAQLASLARRAQAPAGAESVLWPVAEAAILGFQVRQVEFPARALPAPADADLNTLLAAVVGSLFADIEAKANFWQRSRAFVSTTNQSPGTTADQTIATQNTDETMQMINSFHLASDNLTELWSLVLPPQSLLALKKLARMPAEEFSIDASLWARIVYDFTLAFHARTLNRSHLLGAMTPLYLAWVASYLRAVEGDEARAARQAESIAQAFEREKPYLVSRWRWPDRFNP